MESINSFEPKNDGHFSMFTKTGELIGAIGVMNLDEKDKKAELGYWCAVDHWGKGYTTEAARRVGYKHPNTQGPRLLLDVSIKKEIEHRIAEKAMTADEALSRTGEPERAVFPVFDVPRLRADQISCGSTPRAPL